MCVCVDSAEAVLCLLVVKIRWQINISLFLTTKHHQLAWVIRFDKKKKCQFQSFRSSGYPSVRAYQLRCFLCSSFEKRKIL